MKKSLIIGIIFLIICIGVLVFTEINKSSINYTDIHEITNSGIKTEGVYVKLDATYVAGTITGDSDKSFYVMFGDGVQYIVYIDNKKANEIQKYLLDNPEESYHIEGVTKLIPSSIEENGKKFVKLWLDNNHTHDGSEEESHTHEINTDEFYQYFGYVYLDNTIYNNVITKIITYVTGIFGVVLVIYYINTKYHFI